MSKFLCSHLSSTFVLSKFLLSHDHPTIKIKSMLSEPQHKSLTWLSRPQLTRLSVNTMAVSSVRDTILYTKPVTRVYLLFSRGLVTLRSSLSKCSLIVICNNNSMHTVIPIALDHAKNVKPLYTKACFQEHVCKIL